MERVDTRCEKCIEIAFWHGWHTSQVYDGVEYLQCFHSPKFVDVRPESVEVAPRRLFDGQESWRELDPIQARHERNDRYGGPVGFPSE